MASDCPPPPELLMQAIAGLPLREREVLLLSVRELLSNDEVALRLGISSDAAARLLASALVRLDRALERRRRPWWRLW